MNDAHRAQIVRSQQKDEHYRTYLKSLITDFANSLPGMKTWLKWTKEIDLGADLLYYGLTTLAGYQTLGEEYVNILQINLNKRGVPSKYRRALMIALEIIVPYSIDRLASMLVNKLRKDGKQLEKQRHSLADAVELIKNVVKFLHKYHLALFYISGLFYTIAKRFLGIYYVQVRPASPKKMSKSYHVLGVLMVLQLTITSIHRFYKVWSLLHGTKNQKLSTWDSIKKFFLFSEECDEDCSAAGKMPQVAGSRRSPVNVSSRKCCLCQESVREVTSTTCGHVFCWKCILDWCRTKPECPVCREKIVPSKLIRLQNFV